MNYTSVVSIFSFTASSLEIDLANCFFYPPILHYIKSHLKFFMLVEINIDLPCKFLKRNKTVNREVLGSNQLNVNLIRIRT